MDFNTSWKLIDVSLIIFSDIKYSYGLNQIVFIKYSFNSRYILIFLEVSGNTFLHVKVLNHRQSILIFALRDVKEKGVFTCPAGPFKCT